ncbi:MAG: 2-oxoglutarate dehydrogenase E1 component, partial [Candidatus Dadabacteria bacterium]
MQRLGDFELDDFGLNQGLVSELYELYQTDKALVGEEWKRFFDGVQSLLRPSSGETAGEKPEAQLDFELCYKVFSLISAYRTSGHLKAKINPLNLPIPTLPKWEEADRLIASLTTEELGKEVPVFGFAGLRSMRLEALIDKLESIYCGSVGVEYEHIYDESEKKWIREQIESRESFSLSKVFKLQILKLLIFAEEFETQLHKKYLGHKRYSLEGGETVIPMLVWLSEVAPQEGVKEIVIGMPHRGRLNVLSNVLLKPLEEILREFDDQVISSAMGWGDMKYHMGYECDHVTSDGEKVHLVLGPNPSHLEFVNPVIEGIARAKQDLVFQRERKKVLPLLLHGDAAVIGQGIVSETLNFSRTAGHTTGGTVHIVVNNQIGFTTNPDEGRSAPYATDVFKAFQAPVFHVNAEDPEAACWCVETALKYRQFFGKDVVVDLYCYRKRGHNEVDDPSYTQPAMYRQIKKKEKLSEIYSKQLIKAGAVSKEDSAQLTKDYHKIFDETYSGRSEQPVVDICPLHGKIASKTFDTFVPLPRLKEIAKSFLEFPDDFTVHPKLKKVLHSRLESLEKERGVDWAFAEALAFGSLLQDGIGIRLSGQDVIRGTFSHRHLGLRDYQSERLFFPLQKFCGEGVSLDIYNSTLSEAGILGFEFGYSTMATRTLTLWEAQFGDFANTAQVIIDQFIAPSEAKWSLLSGLVLLLPHGYEGQGPEHSSARIERYLQLAAEGNIRVCIPSSSSQ